MLIIRHNGNVKELNDALSKQLVDVTDKWTCLLLEGVEIKTPLVDVEGLLNTRLKEDAVLAGVVGSLVIEEDLDWRKLDDGFLVGNLNKKTKSVFPKRYACVRNVILKNVENDVASLDCSCLFFKTEFLKSIEFDVSAGTCWFIDLCISNVINGIMMSVLPIVVNDDNFERVLSSEDVGYVNKKWKEKGYEFPVIPYSYIF